MYIFIVGLILFGSFSSSLSDENCRLDEIQKAVARFCQFSKFSGCTTEFEKFSTFLKPFLKHTEFFCYIKPIDGWCKACSTIIPSLIAGLGNETSAAGNGSVVLPEIKQ